MGKVDMSLHNYPFSLLFDKSLEETNLIERAVAIFREVLRLKPEVLIVSYADKAYLPIIFLSKLLGIKLIMNFNSNAFDQNRNFFVEKFKSLMAMIPVRFFSYGTTQAEYVETLGVPREKIVIRYQTTDIEKFNNILSKNKEVQKSNTILYVGRITKIKNIRFLIDCFLKSNTDDWQLKLIGDGDQLEELKSYVEKLGVKNIKFEGGKNQEEVINYYSKSRIFVLPSLMEPWGLVVNEALVCSLPVLISTRCGACKDLVKEGVNGYSFDPKNENDLIDKINLLTSKNEDLNDMGRHSASIIKSYTPETTANQMIAGIESIWHE